MAYTFLDFAFDVLKSATFPLTYQEIWEIGQKKGFDKKLRTNGKTPWYSVGAQLYVDTRDNEKSKFIKVGIRPTRFFLKEKEHELKQDVIETVEKIEIAKKEPKINIKEKNLHELLTYYTNSSLFKRGKSIYTKTICHEKSLKPGCNQWVYPDMVGFYMPIDDWSTDVIELNRISDNNALQLYSFEIKVVLDRSNYRQSFFQAVSNSSWAHEGYLVTTEIAEDEELQTELKRLASSFGIGIIKLDLPDIDSSDVIYPARFRESLDWETINKLCDQNPEFKKFIQDVKIDFEGKRIHAAEYDHVEKDIYAYIKDVLKIKPLEKD
ncbi:MAG TPA: HTH domain-containing protein [Candidatus Kapabacteria bacterium]|nr:HTH domain-containing protein [Candidatus Kapabacteria bacterium]